MTKRMTHLIFVMGICFIAGCKDFIEPNLSKSSVSILAPTNHATLSTTSVTFWWDTLAGATQYEVQVVSPNFGNIQFLAVDSNVVGNKFIYTFLPGNYEWRIRAVNNSSATDFTLASFTIDSSLNLSNQPIQLVSPIQNFITNKLTVNFMWFPVFYATDYRFEILSSTGSTVFVNASYPKDTISYSFSNSDTYTWRVRAQNANSVSPYATFSLLVDNVAPLLPYSLTPANSSTNSNPINFIWTQSTDNGSAIFDSLYLFRGVNQDTFVKAHKVYPSSFTDSLPPGNYYWKLRAIDSAGNYSGYTPWANFIVQ